MEGLVVSSLQLGLDDGHGQPGNPELSNALKEVCASLRAEEGPEAWAKLEDANGLSETCVPDWWKGPAPSEPANEWFHFVLELTEGLEVVVALKTYKDRRALLLEAFELLSRWLQQFDPSRPEWPTKSTEWKSLQESCNDLREEIEECLFAVLGDRDLRIADEVQLREFDLIVAFRRICEVVSIGELHISMGSWLKARQDTEYSFRAAFEAEKAKAFGHTKSSPIDAEWLRKAIYCELTSRGYRAKEAIAQVWGGDGSRDEYFEGQLRTFKSQQWPGRSAAIDVIESPWLKLLTRLSWLADKYEAEMLDSAMDELSNVRSFASSPE